MLSNGDTNPLEYTIREALPPPFHAGSHLTGPIIPAIGSHAGKSVRKWGKRCVSPIPIADDFVINTDTTITDFHVLIAESPGGFDGNVQYAIYEDDNGPVLTRTSATHAAGTRQRQIWFPG